MPGVVGDAVGTLVMMTQVDCWTLRQNPVMDRWKLVMFAARRGPGVKLSSTNSKPEGKPGDSDSAWDLRTAAVVSAPWPRSSG